MTFAQIVHGRLAPAVSLRRARVQAGEPQPRRGFLLRIVDAVADSNRRKAEREIARFIERNGGRITDRLERAIEHRYGAGER
jgi:hypothetical protein